MTRYGFSAKHRIKKKSEFERVQREGKRLHSKHFLILVAAAPLDCSRLGLAVTRKVEKRACRRNTLKRRLRELFRLNRHRLRGNFDVLIVARRDACACSFAEIEREVLGALWHNRYIVRSAPDPE